MYVASLSNEFIYFFCSVESVVQINFFLEFCFAFQFKYTLLKKIRLFYIAIRSEHFSLVTVDFFILSTTKRNIQIRKYYSDNIIQPNIEIPKLENLTVVCSFFFRFNFCFFLLYFPRVWKEFNRQRALSQIIFSWNTAVLTMEV